MKNKLFQHQLSVKKSPLHGYGVFAETHIATDELIEECRTIVMQQPAPELSNFHFDATQNRYAVALGYGSIYNHSDQPNARFIMDAEQEIMEFHALKEIRSGEEILISYGDRWFSERKIGSKKLSAWHKLWFYGANPVKFAFLRGLFVLALLKFFIDILQSHFA